jgi:hypothetical protein
MTSLEGNSASSVPSQLGFAAVEYSGRWTCSTLFNSDALA